MDVGRVAQPDFQNISNVDTAKDREQAVKNAFSNIQARYGEKPKEGRAIKKSLDKDDFMKIMITEMKHQDPTKPMDAEKLSGQMAQLTSVEQLKNVNSSIDKLVEKNNASDRLAMSAMIGKTVTVDKGRFSHQKGFMSPVSYQLPEDAAKVKVSVLDEAGEEVFSREIDPQKKGAQSYNWDGLANNGIYSKSGNYAVRIDAENDKGVKIKVDPVSKETIVGVSFEGGDTNFIVGTGKNNQKVSMRNVIRIEGNAGINRSPGSNEAQAEAVKKEESNSAFTLPKELQERFAGQVEPAVETAAEKPEGFPNGLQE